MAVNTEYIGYRLKMPLGPIDIALRCSSDWKTKLTCELDEGGVVKFIEATLEDLVEGAIWVIREIDEWGGKAVQTLGAAINRAGEKAAEVFSTENVRNTFYAILNNQFTLDDAHAYLKDVAAIGFELLSLCEEGGNKWPDGTACVSSTQAFEVLRS